MELAAADLGEGLMALLQPSAKLTAMKRKLGGKRGQNVDALFAKTLSEVAAHNGPFAARVDDRNFWESVIRPRCQRRGGEPRRPKVGRGWFLARSGSDYWAVGGFASQQQLEAAADTVVAEAKRRLKAGKAYFVVCNRFDDEFERRLHLFPSTARRDELRLDAEALYSISDERSARDVAGIAADLAAATIVDATACIGGNCFEFARLGSAMVVAMEIDATRFNMLTHNLSVLGLDDVATLRGDCVELLPDVLRRASKPALVFVDPPWGGPGYRYKPDSTIQLANGSTLEDLARVCHDSGAAHVLYKLPAAYDASALAARWHLEDRSISPKVKLLVCHLCRKRRRRS